MDSDASLRHCPTGVDGLDQITSGGVPLGRTTLVAGGAGCGKTLLALEFVVRGAEAGQAGVFVSFEQTPDELARDVASLGWDLPALQAAGALVVDHVALDPGAVEFAGDYDLEALFIRLGQAIDEVGATRVAIDTLEALFSSFPDTARLRAELRRLFAWLRDRGVTSIVTAESGPGRELTRHGLEEYVADCVIALDHRVHDQVAVRRIRVVKLRGSAHATNEFPFVIGARGFSVVPVTAFGLEHPASDEVVPTGIGGLDGMLGRGGWFRGSVTMVSGESGTGKTTFAAAFADAACSRGQRCTYLAFEESPEQLVRNMTSVGLRLGEWVGRDLLRIHASRPTENGLERHLTLVYEQVEAHRPDVVVIDPVTDFTALGHALEVKALLMRIVDYLKNNQITSVMTSLQPSASEDATMSSLIDNFVQLANVADGTRRRRALYIQKARGMAHSAEVRPFEIGHGGITILDYAVDEQVPA